MDNLKIKIYLTIFIFIVLVASMALFLVYPALIDIQKTSASLISAKQDVVLAQGEVQSLQNFQHQYPNIQPNLEKIDSLFLDLNSPVDFITYLEKISNDSGISSQISLPPSSSIGQQKYIIVQIASLGGLNNIIDFCRRMENGSYLIEIKDMTIQQQDQKYNANLSIKVFIKN